MRYRCARGSSLGPRSGAHRRGRRRRAGVPQLRRSGAARGALGVSPLLAGRAPQHARHRQRGDRHRHRPRRRRDVDHPGRRRRDHAPQSRAADHRRAVRHAGRPSSRADRSRPRARAGDRPGDGVCAAPNVDRRPGQLPRRRRRAPLVPPSARGGTAGAGRARRRRQPRGLDPRLQPVRRRAGRDDGPSVRLRLALRAGALDGGGRDLPPSVSTVRAARAPSAHARRQRRRRRHRRGGRPASHVAAASLRQPPQRQSHPPAAACAGLRRAPDAATGSPAGRSPRLRGGRLPRHGPAVAWRASSRAPRPTSSS